MTFSGDGSAGGEGAKRPDWVQRVNDEGTHMDIKSVVPLDAASLMTAAQRDTGLSNYGKDTWREPFEIIARAMDEEADLNLMGRLMCRSDMLNFLKGRLQIEETYRLHPEIEDEEIIKPFIIVGQGRSGTSALLNLMSKDPESGGIRTWEAILPCPPPEKSSYETDARISRGDALITQWNRVNPAIEAFHEFAGEIPASCVHIMCYNFMSVWFRMLAQMPSYFRYYAQSDMTDTFQYHKRILKLLQWRNPRGHWVLKSPSHLRMMPTILKVYPDACFIWPHRDPLKAIVSTTNFARNCIYSRTDHCRMEGYEDNMRPERVAAALEQPIEWLKTGEVPHENLCNIQYQDFISRPVETVARIYEHFDVKFSPEARQAMEKYMHDNPRESRPANKYNEKEMKEIIVNRDTFSKYQNYFDVPNEI